MQTPPLDDLLNQPVVVINVGLAGFAEELHSQGVTAVQVDWVPPAGGDSELADLLSRLGRIGQTGSASVTCEVKRAYNSQFRFATVVKFHFFYRIIDTIS